MTTDYKDEGLKDQINSILINKEIILSSQDNIKDLTYLKTYTIDDYETKEVDDAISIELLDDYYKLWIHISSPTEFFQFNSQLDLFVRDKAATNYLHNSISYMFPIDLVTNIFSLEPNKVTNALSVGLTFNVNGSVNSIEVRRSIINVSYKLTYEEADELLDYSPDEEYELIKICEILQKSLSYRLSNGAIDIEEQQGVFTLKENKIMHKVIEISKSRKLIQEAMIIYGFAIASFSSKNNLLVPYRVQSKPLNLPLKSKANLICSHIYNFQLKQSFNKSYISLVPNSHFSLGLPHYVQVTSPLRRYIDIISQYQIIAFVTQRKPIIQLDDMQNIIDIFNMRTSQLLSISRSAKQSIIVKWFHQNKDQIWKAMFLKWLNKSKSLALIYIISLEIDIVSKIDSKPDLELGSSFNVKLNKANMINNLLEFSLF